MRRRVYELTHDRTGVSRPSLYAVVDAGCGGCDPSSPLPDIALTLRACGARDDGAMERGTILVVDDEPNIADLVELYLAREGYRVLQAATGEAGLEAVSTHRPRLVVLDVGLPDIDGLEVVQAPAADVADPGDLPHRARRRGRPRARPRARRRRLPHEAVLARRARRAGEGGAAPGRRRSRARGRPGRRHRPSTAGGARCGCGDDPVEFTTKEFDLLRFLAERPGLALSRQQILDGVWGYDWFGDARTVDVHIAQVRKKLGDAATITTVRGVGYRLESSRSASATT